MMHKFSNFMAGFCKPKPELKATNQINDLAAEKDKLLGQNTHAQKKEPITNDAQSRYSSNQPLIQERHPAIQAVQPQLQADSTTPNLQIIDNSSTNYSNSQRGKKKKKKRRVQKQELTQIEAVEDEEIEADHAITKESP
jgi:DNA-binding protein H-NS